MKKKILCIEDNPTIRILVEAVLRDDYEVVTAENGTLGLHKIYDFRPDLIVLDIMLPDMSGHDICAKLKSTDEFSHTPVIMLSSNTDIESKITSYNLGAINYVEKPFDRNEFKAMIGSILSRVANSKTMALNFGDMSFSLDSQSVQVDGKKVDLTPSEFKLLVAIVKEKGAIVERHTLTKLFGDNNDDESVDRIINYHMSLLRKKIAHSSVRISSIYGRGYKAQLNASL